MHTEPLTKRSQAIALATQALNNHTFFDVLTRRVAMKTESQHPEATNSLFDYLNNELQPVLSKLGFHCDIFPNPIEGKPPLMIAERKEATSRPTLLIYGHGDVTKGEDHRWQAGLSPWQLTQIDDRLYGRGTADNKGQHTINLLALEAVLKTRAGKLGYNLKILFEMGEEIGSVGLAEFCQQQQARLAADLFLASDGPRLNASSPTIFLGSRGICQFRLRCQTTNGARHSGNWGGVITNPAIRLQHALSTLVSAHGDILADCLNAPRPTGLTAKMMRQLPVGGQPGDPELNPDWGATGLTDGERLFGCNTLEIIAFNAGNIKQPIGVIPTKAEAVCHLRLVPGTDFDHLIPNLKSHLVERGFNDIEVQCDVRYNATRLEPTHPWVSFVKTSIEATLQQTVTVLPNLGGTIPNHCFADILNLPTVWLPHSYPSCQQHAPDEHLLIPIVRQGLAASAGVFWDLGERWPA